MIEPRFASAFAMNRDIHPLKSRMRLNRTPGAFDTFAASRDLVHWTHWNGDDLVKASEPYDTPFAHKPWIIKHDDVVYHFYCAVGGKEQHRSIALATSKDLHSPVQPSAPRPVDGR